MFLGCEALEKVKRGRSRGISSPFSWQRKHGNQGLVAGGDRDRSCGGFSAAAEQDTHSRRAPEKVTWGHRWLEGHALE